MTPAQIQEAYRLAVESCLVEFYGKTTDSAQALVNRWWKRASSGPDSEIKSGSYLHVEAINIATDLASVDQVQITDSVRKRYAEILRQSSLAARKQLLKPKMVRRISAAKQMVG